MKEDEGEERKREIRETSRVGWGTASGARINMR
jgi:hypothetical protein